MIRILTILGLLLAFSIGGYLFDGGWAMSLGKLLRNYRLSGLDFKNFIRLLRKRH